MSNEKMATVADGIAARRLSIKTLNEQFSDGLDFHEVHVVALYDALCEAYKAGQNDMEAMIQPSDHDEAEQAAEREAEAEMDRKGRGVERFEFGRTDVEHFHSVVEAYVDVYSDEIENEPFPAGTWAAQMLGSLNLIRKGH